MSFVIDPFPADFHPHQQQQPAQRQQQQWPPHLLTNNPPFPSPPPSEHGYNHYFQQQQPQQDSRPNNAQLSLNLSSLSVTSPTNVSPIANPATPISPSTNPFSTTQQQSPFQYDPHHQDQGQQSSPTTLYDDQQQHPQQPTGSAAAARPVASRSSSTSSQLPRKRSFTSNASTTATLVEESMFDEARDTAMDLSGASAYDDLDMRHAYASSTGGGTSPVDGSGSNSGAEDTSGSNSLSLSIGGSMNVLGKPMATNNFVTKLYQMINDPKSAHFISWTELGTSFVVSNVGEFSRSILGSHFKHNNFSSFVRQLNMYGFHKINRTPRAQRTSTDAQTWEFSHHKFLRGRPDLLDEIKRKALEPDPALKHRVELPGEVAAQLSAMRDENRRMADQLSTERKRVDNLVHVVGRLWDVMKTTFPGTVGQFPQELVEADSPNIYITSPTATTSRYPPPLTMNINNPTLHTMHSMSPNSSPTAADFPTHLPHHQPQHHSHHQHQLHPHTLSRQHSFQHLNGYGARGDSSSSTPLPSSPGSGSMDLMDDFEHGRASNKRPRLSSHSESSSLNGGDSGSLLSTVSSPGSSTSPPSVLSNGAGLKAGGGRSSRARSDSAPLGVGGYSLANGGGGLGAIGWHAVNGMRPRSGSGLVSMGPRIPNIGAMSRGGVATPLLSIATHDVLSR